MNRGTIPIIARLEALQTAARLAPGGARTIAAMTDANPLAALLCELNETILGRTLTFESSGGSRLSLEVSGRRVLRVTAAQGLVGADACLAAPALEDAQKDDLIKLLQAAAPPRQELRVTASPMDREGAEVSVGLPVALLADLLLVNLNPIATDALPEATSSATPPEPEERPRPRLVETETANGSLLGFVQAIGPSLMAWLISGGDDDGKSDGPEEMVSHLGGFLGDEAAALSTQLDRTASTAGVPACLVVGASLLEGHSILCARAGDALLLGLMDGAAAKALPQAWSAAFA